MKHKGKVSNDSIMLYNTKSGITVRSEWRDKLPGRLSNDAPQN